MCPSMVLKPEPVNEKNPLHGNAPWHANCTRSPTNSRYKHAGTMEGTPLLLTTAFLFFGTVSCVLMAVDFLRPIRETHPF